MPKTPRNKRPDAFSLFCFATAYWKGRWALNREFTRLGIQTPYDIPEFVVEAFSLELHLKCLLRVEKKELPGSHEPEYLYHALTPPHRRMIREYAKKPLGEMRSILARSRGVFKDLRYMHEGHKWPEDKKGRTGTDGFNEVVHAIRRIIKEKHKDWDAKKNALLAI